ncbi:hypothetical protein [Phenylobacterium sp.]|uniref:hypothetical protein n=1 Tax=Phenylobacterium sp. TaxID=1871053 RepID=UPI0030F378EF
MSTSSAAQREFDFTAPMDLRGDGGDVPSAPRNVSTSENSGTGFRAPNFSQFSSGVEADAARRAGRINARSTPEHEYRKLLIDRQTLLDKKFDGTISRQESNRLEYIRWSLDRIEDARHGHSLEMLESAIARYENFAEEIDGLRKQLGAAKSGSRRK